MIGMHGSRATSGTVLLLTVALLGVKPGGAEAQVPWESPLMVSPQAPAGWSILMADPEPGEGIAAVVGWRTAAVPVGFGLRGGIGEGHDGNLALFGGVDASGSLVSYSDEMPFDLLWVAGGGLGVGAHVLLSFPLGLTAGWALPTESVEFRPYVGPRIVFDARLGEGSDELDLEAAVDLGFDVALEAGLVLRFAASVGGRSSLAAGVALAGRGRRGQ